MERSDTRAGRIPLEQLCFLFSYTIQSMKECQGSEPFWKAVDTSVHEFYRHYVAHPMDLSLLEEKVRRKSYGSTEAFEADAKWIVHNCTVFNTPQHNLTAVAKKLMRVCSAAMNAIESCPDCYLRSFRDPDDYFTEICPVPHLPVWAKLKGFPHWPAKVMRMRGDEIEVRFFGDHDRSWLKDCFVYSKTSPSLYHYKKGYDKLRDAVDEMKDYIAKLEEEFGKFVYAEQRTPFDPNKQVEHLMACIPNYKRETRTTNGNPSAATPKTDPPPAAPKNNPPPTAPKNDPPPPTATPRSTEAVTRDIRVPALMNMDDIAAVMDVDRARRRVSPLSPTPSLDDEPRSVSVSAWDEFQSVNGINIINVMTIEKSAFDQVDGAEGEEEDGDRCYALSDGESRSPARGRSPRPPKIKVIDASSLMAKTNHNNKNDDDARADRKEGQYARRGGFLSKRFGIVRERDEGTQQVPEHAYSRVGDMVDCTRSSTEPEEATSDGDSRPSVLSLGDAAETTLATSRPFQAVGAKRVASEDVYSIIPDPHAIDPLACDVDKASDDVVVIEDRPTKELELPAAVRNSNQVVVVPVVKDKGEVVVVPVVEDRAKESSNEVVLVKESQQQQKMFAASRGPVGGGSSEGAVAAVSGGNRTETYLDPKTGEWRSIFLPEGAAGGGCVSPPAAREGDSLASMYSGGGVTITVAHEGRRKGAFTTRELGATVNLSKAVSLSVIKGCRRDDDVTLANLLNTPPSSAASPPRQTARKSLAHPAPDPMRRDSGADNRRNSSGSERAVTSPFAGGARNPHPMVVIPATVVAAHSSGGSGISQYTAGSSLPLNFLQAQVSGVRLGGGAQTRFTTAATATSQSGPCVPAHQNNKHEPPIPPDAWSSSVQQQILHVINNAIQERAGSDPKAALAVLQSELNKQAYLHTQEIKELKHYFTQSFSESQASFASALEQSRVSLAREHQRAQEESQRLHDGRCRELDKRCRELEQAVEMAKKKQWCTVCGEEAQLYCCWNTSYCDYACQEHHWQVHMEVCRQKEQNSDDPEPQDVGPVPNNNNNNSNHNNTISLKPSTLYQGTTMGNKPRQLSSPIRTPTPPLRPINQFTPQRIVREGESPLIRIAMPSPPAGPQSPPPRFTMLSSRGPIPGRIMVGAPAAAAGSSRPAPYPIIVPRPPQVSRSINTSTTSTTCSSASSGPVTTTLYKLSNPLKPNTGQRFINIGSQKYVVVESNNVSGDKSIVIAKPVQQACKVSATATPSQGDKSNVIAKSVQQVGKVSPTATPSQGDKSIMIAKHVQQLCKELVTATPSQGDKSNVIAKSIQQVGKVLPTATPSQGDKRIMIAKPIQQVGKLSLTATSPQGDKSILIDKPVQQLCKESATSTPSQGDKSNVIVNPVHQVGKVMATATSPESDKSSVVVITKSVQQGAVLRPGDVRKISSPVRNDTKTGAGGSEDEGGIFSTFDTSEETAKGTLENALAKPLSPAPCHREKSPAGFVLAPTLLFSGYESPSTSPPPERSTFDLAPATGLDIVAKEFSSSPAE